MMNVMEESTLIRRRKRREREERRENEGIGEKKESEHSVDMCEQCARGLNDKKKEPPIQCL
jgi:hypothetical protein